MAALEKFKLNFELVPAKILGKRYANKKQTTPPAKTPHKNNVLKRFFKRQSRVEAVFEIAETTLKARTKKRRTARKTNRRLLQQIRQIARFRVQR